MLSGRAAGGGKTIPEWEKEEAGMDIGAIGLVPDKGFRNPGKETLRKLKAGTFIVVLALVALGGLYALPIMSAIVKTEGHPTAEFWLLIGGGVASVGATMMLAERLGYLKPVCIAEPKAKLAARPTEVSDWSKKVNADAQLARATEHMPEYRQVI